MPWPEINCVSKTASGVQPSLTQYAVSWSEGRWCNKHCWTVDRYVSDHIDLCCDWTIVQGWLDCYTVLVWWHCDCQWGRRPSGLQLAGITLLWLAGLKIGWDCLSHNGLLGDVTAENFRRFSETNDNPLAQHLRQANTCLWDCAEVTVN